LLSLLCNLSAEFDKIEDWSLQKDLKLINHKVLKIQEERKSIQESLKQYFTRGLLKEALNLLQ